MLTIFAVPKPFVGHDGVIQRNALGTWTQLRPVCQIILCGDDEGVADTAAQYGVEHLASVEVNEFGTPLLHSVFNGVEDRASFPLLCYVNADILLLSDFIDAVGRLAEIEERFLMVGQRWDLDLTEPLDLTDASWERDLRERVGRDGVLHPPAGSDYFVYRRGTIGPLPPFAVGRAGWDNWMLAHALGRNIPVVDATESALIVHQNHGYEHVKERTGAAYQGTETTRNLDLMGEGGRVAVLADATHRLAAAGVVRVGRLRAFMRRRRA